MGNSPGPKIRKKGAQWDAVGAKTKKWAMAADSNSKTRLRHWAKTEKRARAPTRNSEKTLDGVVKLFKKRWRFKMSCSSGLGFRLFPRGSFSRRKTSRHSQKQDGVVGLKKDGTLR